MGTSTKTWAFHRRDQKKEIILEKETGLKGDLSFVQEKLCLRRMRNSIWVKNEKQNRITLLGFTPFNMYCNQQDREAHISDLKSYFLYYIMFGLHFMIQFVFLYTSTLRQQICFRFSPVGKDFPRSPESSVETGTKMPSWRYQSLCNHN